MQEIEIKARYTNCTQSELEEYLIEHHYVRHQRIIQKDQYYNHPSRDFRKTDEALRIRIEQDEDGKSHSFITYKGANQSHTGQSRLEIETTLTDAESTHRILESLGFTSVATVYKDRTEFRRDDITICLDTLEGLGTYLEIEKLLPEGWKGSGHDSHSESETESQLLEMLQEFDFTYPVIETSTYLELVLRQS